jgi:hypothetical protein
VVHRIEDLQVGLRHEAHHSPALLGMHEGSSSANGGCRRGQPDEPALRQVLDRGFSACPKMRGVIVAHGVAKKSRGVRVVLDQGAGNAYGSLGGPSGRPRTPRKGSRRC